MTVDVAVEDLRAHRILISGLGREARDARALAVLDWGVQDSGAGSARLAMANRLADPLAIPDVGEPGSSSALTMGWTWRGSPHVHRRPDFPRLARALWPDDAADATARLVGSGKGLVEAGADPVQAYRVVAGALRAVVTEPMTKGAASSAVTAAVPPEYSSFCRPCGVTHVREMLFRCAALPASVGTQPDTKPVLLAPMHSSHPIPATQAGLADYAAVYLRLYGVGSAAEIGAVLGTSGSAARAALGETVAATVAGRRTLASPHSLVLMAEVDVAAARSLVRLLGPSDPLLQARDRATLVAEPARRSLLWPMIGAPGALLAGGEIAGVWRTRQAGKKLTITLTAWRRLTAGERSSLTNEVEVVGAARGVTTVDLVID